mmetsp:Transcript_9159/g.11454  ORF Transcript_9159/g.11454 Transcript_9159/m.11454 type:complete len:276 (-) Transcript_9159:260-1087(-)
MSNYSASRRNVIEMKERELEETQEDAEVESGKKFLKVFGKLIPSIFALLALGILGVWIWGFIDVEMKKIIIWIILGCSLLASMLGAWAVYKYGVIQDQIDRLKEENTKYQAEIDVLSQTRKKLGNEVNDLQNTVNDLKQNAAELERETQEFKGLITELEKIAGDNEDISNLLDNTNKIFKDMRKVVLENERAHLLSTYYECAFRDEQNKMRKNEYQAFLFRLSRKQRERFQKLGTFEQLAGADGELDLNEFQDILEEVLKDVDELLKEEFENAQK